MSNQKRTINIVYDGPKQGASWAWFEDRLKQLTAEFTISNEVKQGSVNVICGKHLFNFIEFNSLGSFDSLACYVLKGKNGIIIPTYAPEDMYSARPGLNETTGEKVLNPYNKFIIDRSLVKADSIAFNVFDSSESIEIENDRIEILLNRIPSKIDQVCIDLETTVGDSLPESITAIGMSFNTSLSFCASSDQPVFNKLLNLVKLLMEDSNVLKIGQNFINFDAPVLYHLHGIKLYGRVWDTQDVFRLLYPDIKRSSLAVQGAAFLTCEPWKDASWSATGAKLREYCAKDTLRTFRIKEAQDRELIIQGNKSYYERVLLNTGALVTRAITKGINFDHAELKKQTENIKPKIAELETKLRELANPYLSPKRITKRVRSPRNDTLIECIAPSEFQKMKRSDMDVFIKQNLSLPDKELKEYYITKKQDGTNSGLIPGRVYKKAYKDEITLKKQIFNPSSPLQVKSVLTNMGVKLPGKRNNSGDWVDSTDSLSLLKIKIKYYNNKTICDFVTTLGEYKPLIKFNTSYLNARFMSDGRWRSSFHLRGTETGRASSKKYFSLGKNKNSGFCGNIQNIPSRGYSAEFKKCFIPDDGYIWFNFDQSAAESRIVAYLAQCKKLIEILETGQDFHLITAKSVFNDPTLTKTSPLRNMAKPLNHGSSYGMGTYVIHGSIIKSGFNISKEEVEVMLNRWHQTYPEIRAVFHKAIKEELLSTSSLTNPLGRRRYFLGPKDDKMLKQAYADIPQSTIPDISNIMWQKIAARWKDDEAMVLIQCHDSLAGQVRADLKDEFLNWFKAESQGLELSIKGSKVVIPWDLSVGRNYYDCK